MAIVKLSLSGNAILSMNFVAYRYLPQIHWSWMGVLPNLSCGGDLKHAHGMVML